MYGLLKELLFLLDGETSHDLSLASLNLAERLGLLSGFLPKPVYDPVTLWGIRFNNRVGLAAGLDKNAQFASALGQMGFGFIEVGTVTPRPQTGNPKPRLFRLKEHEAIINRMGFNNFGIDELLSNVRACRFDGPIGINIGKNATTPVENALDDYLIGLNKAYDHASYITINISSPNTEGLRTLQYGAALDQLLNGLKAEQNRLIQHYGYHVPLLVKIAPDCSDSEIKVIADAIQRSEMEGVIATNTTLSRSEVKGHTFESEKGGLSGKPLINRSLSVVECLASELPKDIPIVGVGGISSAEDAEAMISAGASLVQIYSGLIYQGPALVRACAARLSQSRS